MNKECHYNDIDMIESIPNNLARYPSNEEFDKENALKTSFGLSQSNAKLSQLNQSFNSECDQLGVMVDNQIADEMERISFEQNQSDWFWPQTDKMYKPHFARQQVPQTSSGPISMLFTKMETSRDFNLNNDDLELGIPRTCNHKVEEDKDQMSCDEEEIKQNNENSNNDIKETRWSKEDDKRLFSTYRSLWIKEMLNIKEVLSTPLRKNKQYNSIIETVGKNVGWTGKKAMLVRRLK